MRIKPADTVLRCWLFVFAITGFALDRYQAEAEKLNELMHWRSGNVIAELGAGEGQMSFVAADRVGPEGRVYATELDTGKVDRMKQETVRRHISNLTVLQADAVETELPPNCCDDIFMRRVYHHFRDPAGTSASIWRALKPGGFLAIIEFTPRGSHGISKKKLVNEITAAGFEIVQPPEDWAIDGDYCLLARKPVNS